MERCIYNMSVLASQRKTGDLTVIIKAKENAIYTLKITHNEKRFPKRYRFSVTNKLQDLAIDILTNLIQANEIFPRTTEEYQHRLFLQRKAMASCRALNTLIYVASECFSIEKKTVAFWGRNVTEIRNMTVSWMNKDRSRFKDLCN